MAMPTVNPLSYMIKSKAIELGLDLIGITRADKPPDSGRFKKWLEQGFQADMQYLERGYEKRMDPGMILKNVRSVVSTGLIYYSEKKETSIPKTSALISNYAWGRDYHTIFLDILKKLENYIVEIAPAAHCKSYVDTGPVLERSFARQAGLGWIGKNTCLIHPDLGSYFFIGEILTDIILEYDLPFASDHCGTCTRCLDACPTEALTKPGVLDASLCISYLTIEHRGEIPEGKRIGLQNHLSGCDICQEVCPYNRDPIPTRIEAFHSYPFLSDNGPGTLSLEKAIEISPAEFKTLFSNSAIQRLKYEGFFRNIIIAMANSENSRYIPRLQSAKLKTIDPELKKLMDWAIETLESKRFSQIPDKQ